MKFNEEYLPGLGRSAAVEALVVAKAQAIADTARATAPVDTGEYRDTIRVDVDHTPFRVVAHVVADCDHAMIVESRTGNLSRALRSNTRG